MGGGAIGPLRSLARRHGHGLHRGGLWPRRQRYLAQVVNEAFEEIDRLDAQMSNYRPESELSGINRHGARQPVIVEPKLFQLIRDSVRYSEETAGAFDVTVGPLM